MVGGDDENVVRAQLRHSRAEPGVKGVQSLGISYGILAVTVFHIKVNEIDEAKSVEIAVKKLVRLRHSLVVIMRGVD